MINILVICHIIYLLTPTRKACEDCSGGQKEKEKAKTQINPYQNFDRGKHQKGKNSEKIRTKKEENLERT